MANASESESVELVVEGHSRDLGGFSVRRVLPAAARRRVGPFTFFDHVGPTVLAAGKGFDVRPHPHIGLATVTYLFDGAFDHKDSLGSAQSIRPGDVNWMIAGRGVVHSERSSPESRLVDFGLHGIQTWIALPLEHEEHAPSFEHHPAATIPRVTVPGATLDVVVGTAYGRRSPVSVLSPTLYVHAQLEAGARVAVDDEHEERAVYVVEGAIECEGRTFEPGTLVVLRPGAKVNVSCTVASRAMFLGGAKLEGERHIWWNFVSSSMDRIARAKDEWRSGRFPKVPGDDVEFIPLPDE